MPGPSCTPLFLPGRPARPLRGGGLNRTGVQETTGCSSGGLSEVESRTAQHSKEIQQGPLRGGELNPRERRRGHKRGREQTYERQNKQTPGGTHEHPKPTRSLLVISRAAQTDERCSERLRAGPASSPAWLRLQEGGRAQTARAHHHRAPPRALELPQAKTAPNRLQDGGRASAARTQDHRSLPHNASHEREAFYRKQKQKTSF